MKLYTKYNEGTSLIKHGSWTERSSLRLLNLLITLRMLSFELNIVSDTNDQTVTQPEMSDSDENAAFFSSWPLVRV